MMVPQLNGMLESSLVASAVYARTAITSHAGQLKISWTECLKQHENALHCQFAQMRGTNVTCKILNQMCRVLVRHTGRWLSHAGSCNR